MTIAPTEPLKIATLSLNHPVSSKLKDNERTKFFPSPRMNAGMAVKHNVLYLYGGMVEEGDRQYTLCDFYSLDCRKLDEWKILIMDDLSSQTWFDSSEDSEEDRDEEDEQEESDNNDPVNVDDKREKENNN